MTLQRLGAAILAAVFCLTIFLPRPALASGDLLCATFPIYLFTRNITQGRDVLKLDLLVTGAQGCPHDYAPTPAELEKLSRANALIINGLGLEGFLSQALKVAKPDLTIIDASGQGPTSGRNLSPVDTGGLFLGRDDLADQPVFHHHCNDPSHDHSGPNPHLFAAPTTAAFQAGRIAEALAVLDPAGAEVYRANAARLIDDLNRVAALLAKAGDELGHPKVMVSHSIFDFLAQDMGLQIVAAIEEEDGADPSMSRLVNLAALAKERGVKAILVDPHGNIDLARTLGAEAKIPVAVIDPVTSGPPDLSPENVPLDYYQAVMLTNLDVLTKLFSAPAPPARKKK